MVGQVLNPQTLPERIFYPLDLAFDNTAEIASHLSFIFGKPFFSYASHLKARITSNSIRKLEISASKTWNNNLAQP